MDRESNGMNGGSAASTLDNNHAVETAISFGKMKKSIIKE